MTPITTTRPVSSLQPGAALARYVKALRFGATFAEQYRDSPQVSNALDVRQRAAIAGLTADAVPDLAQLGVYDFQTAQMFGGVSALEACASRMRRVPFDVGVPRETTTGSGGGWIVDGAAMPVIAYAFDLVRLRPARVGSLFVASDELLRAPQADAVLLAAALGGQGRVESDKFLNPTATASGDQPGSITSTGTSIANTGDVAADLTSALAAITTPGAGLVWIARPTTFAAVAAAIGSASDLPRSLCGLSTIVAPYAPASLLVLADLAAIAFAASPLDVERSDVATVEMEQGPQAIAAGSTAAPIATSQVSLYQSDATAFKTLRYVNWSARDGAVAYLSIDTGSPA